VVTEQQSAERQLAGQLALHLTQNKRPNENQTLVKRYQVQEKARGYDLGVIDGLYGAKTAFSLAQDHGIVPPKPMYWPRDKVKAAAAVKAYRQQIAAFAVTDPARREEWLAASNV
jgi:hypothetical protein